LIVSKKRSLKRLRFRPACYRLNLELGWHSERGTESESDKVFMRRLAVAFLMMAAPLAAQTSLVEEGRVAIDRNDPQDALPLLQRAVAQNPNNANAHYLLGVAYGNLAQKANMFRRTSLARHTRDEFERAVELDPRHLDARWGLVQYYALAPGYLGGSEQKARQEAKEISKRDAALGKRAFDFIGQKK
jgi:tetratricopeptide (TPR) repeat protein